MRPALKAFLVTTVVAGSLVFGAMLLVSPSDATAARDCRDLAIGPGWGSVVDLSRKAPATVSVDAPSGYLIDAYCVKAGGGPEAAVLVTVEPAAASVVIDHPTKPTVRQYAVHLVPISSGSGTSGPSTPPGSSGPSTPPGSSGPSIPPGSSGPSMPPGSSGPSAPSTG